MDCVAFGGGSARLITARSEYSVAREGSATHADLVRAVAAHPCAFVRASLNGASLKLRTAADGWQQIRRAALPANAERILAHPDNAGSGLKGRDPGDPCAETEGKTLDSATLKTRTPHAAAAEARPV